MRQWVWRTATAVVFSAFFLSAPASASTRIFVRIGPPVRVVEARPVVRHRGYVWRDGYYRWNGRRYVWVRGGYERPPYVRAVWYSGRWSHERRGWYWVPGHWVRR
jgi:YXWGXW repeat-containing protein